MALIDFYQKALELAQQEQILIKEVELAALQNTLTQKRAIFAEIENHVSPQSFEIAAIKKIITQIKQINDENQKLLEQELRTTRVRLEKLLKGWNSIKQYSQTPKNEGAILNITG